MILYSLTSFFVLDEIGQCHSAEQNRPGDIWTAPEEEIYSLLRDPPHRILTWRSTSEMLGGLMPVSPGTALFILHLLQLLLSLVVF